MTRTRLQSTKNKRRRFDASVSKNIVSNTSGSRKGNKKQNIFSSFEKKNISVYCHAARTH